jgi:hypothetical protein
MIICDYHIISLFPDCEDRMNCEILDFCCELTQLIAQEDLVNFVIRAESLAVSFSSVIV